MLYTIHKDPMPVRMQLLLGAAEVAVLRRFAKATGKSMSELVREAVQGTYISEFSEEEIADLARGARRVRNRGKGVGLNAALRRLWSL